jgi:hypothetical protein
MEKSDQVQQVVCKLLILERTVYERPLERKTEHYDCDSPVVQPQWRKTILEWMYGLTTKCSLLSRETIAVAAYYLDVSISRGMIASQLEFKVVSITCLNIATKLVDSTTVTLEDLIKLCGDQFTLSDVLEMELRMLTTLQWRLHPPTPNCFVHQFLRLFPNDISPQSLDKICCISQLAIEKAICEPTDCRQFLPSELAYASLLLATEFVGTDADLSIRNLQLWCFRMSAYCKLKSNNSDIRRAIRELGKLITEEENTASRLYGILGERSEKQEQRFHTTEKSASWPNYQRGRINLSPRSPVAF